MPRFSTPIIESRSHGPAVEAPGDGLDGLYQGTLTASPSGGRCTVLVPGLDTVNHMDVFCRADATGSRGDIVLIGFEDNKFGFLILNLGRSAL